MRAPASVVFAFFAAIIGSTWALQPDSKQPPQLGRRSAALLTLDRLQFEDLNRNGKPDIYEDWRQSPEIRASDLVRQMSLDDIAGVMVHGTLPALGGPDAAIGLGSEYVATLPW